MKIIFLDIDGVITSARVNGYRDFDIWAVDWINWCVDNSDSKIVISSTWRTNTTKEFWEKFFGDRLHNDWSTPCITNFRGYEVAEWLEQHPDITEYIILDDDVDFMEDQLPHLINTSPFDGMLWKHMDLLSIMLGIEPSTWPSPDRIIPVNDDFFNILAKKYRENNF